MIWSDFLSDITALRAVVALRETTVLRNNDAVLGEEASIRQSRWLLCCDDSYWFAVALFALLQENCLAVLPPNLQSGTITNCATNIAGIISDMRMPRGEISIVTPWQLRSSSPPDFVGVATDKPCLELLTSGSSGVRKIVSKTLGQLDREISVLEQLWSKHLTRAEIFSSVSHQHIYGLLFRVLWPIACGRVFQSEKFLFPEEMEPMLSASSRICLVSSPAYLSSFSQLTSLKLLQEKCVAVFSSGGPLAKATSDLYFEQLGFAPIEVYGSTETGGIAWRQQLGKTTETQPWRALPQVVVRREPHAGTLVVCSPFVGREQETEFVTADQIDILEDGSFVLLGRADDVVKIGEKRQSLAEIETKLQRQQNGWISDAMAVRLPPSSPEGQSRLGIAAVLSVAGNRALVQLGRANFTATLRNELNNCIDPVFIPRHWKFVDALPCNDQSKRSRADILPLFVEQCLTKSPEVISRSTIDSGFVYRLRVPGDLCYFAGHFPGFPVVPGAVQLRWVIELSAELRETTSFPRLLENIKFHEMLCSEVEFMMELGWDAIKGRLEFKLFGGERKYSSGRITFFEQLSPSRNHPETSNAV